MLFEMNTSISNRFQRILFMTYFEKLFSVRTTAYQQVLSEFIKIFLLLLPGISWILNGISRHKIRSYSYPGIVRQTLFLNLQGSILGIKKIQSL